MIVAASVVSPVDARVRVFPVPVSVAVPLVTENVGLPVTF